MGFFLVESTMIYPSSIHRNFCCIKFFTLNILGQMSIVGVYSHMQYITIYFLVANNNSMDHIVVLALSPQISAMCLTISGPHVNYIKTLLTYSELFH